MLATHNPLSGVRSGGMFRYRWPRAHPGALAGFILAIWTQSAFAGPPYVADDPEPTDYQHFEIYTFNLGTTTRGGTSGESGIDFNYGAAPNLQLTAVLPAGFNQPFGVGVAVGMSNIELAAKYRFLHQDSFGLDVSVFPRVFLPTVTNGVSDSQNNRCKLAQSTEPFTFSTACRR